MAGKNVIFRIGISQNPCERAIDRAELSDEAYLRRHGVSKAADNVCDGLDHTDPNRQEIFLRDRLDAAMLTDPRAVDTRQHNPQAEIVNILAGKSPVLSCANHAQSYKDNGNKVTLITQFFRPRLNPGESPSLQRLFVKRYNYRRQRAEDIAKREREFDAQNNAAEAANPINSTPSNWSSDKFTPVWTNNTELPEETPEETPTTDYGIANIVNQFQAALYGSEMVDGPTDTNASSHVAAPSTGTPPQPPQVF